MRGIFNILFLLNQKDSLWIAKGLVLNSKRSPSARQKDYIFILNQKVEKYKSRLAISCSLMTFTAPLCFTLLLLLLLLTIFIMVSATPCVFTITEKDFLQISSNSSAKEREINSTPSISITHFALSDSLMIFSIAPALLRERISGPYRSKTIMFFSMTSFRRITPYIIYNETIQIYCRDR